MRKLLLLLWLLRVTPIVAIAEYYDLQHYKVVPDTTTVHNDWYFRGDLNIGKDTTTVDASSMPIYIKLLSTGTIEALDIYASTFTGTVSGTATYAQDSNLLDGYNYTHFVDTGSAQNITGVKSFTNGFKTNEIANLTGSVSYLQYDTGNFEVDLTTDTHISGGLTIDQNVLASGLTTISGTAVFYNDVKTYDKTTLVDLYEFTTTRGTMYQPLRMIDNKGLELGNTGDMYIGWEDANARLDIGTGTTVGSNRVIEVTGSSVTVNQDLYAGGSFIVDAGSGCVVGASTGGFLELDGVGDLGVTGELVVKDGARFYSTLEVKDGANLYLTGTANLLFGSSSYWGIDGNNTDLRFAFNSVSVFQMDSSSVTVRERLNVEDVATFNNRVVCKDLLGLAQKTEAELKAMTPVNVGHLYYDSTNMSVVVSTNTTLAGFGQINDGTQVPNGW